MTKHPQYSSVTLWHRDTRYWNFSNKYLVNSWLALTDEYKENGAMRILPASHRWEVRKDMLDAQQFLIVHHKDVIPHLENQKLIELKQGDLLLFSAHCFHAAGKNLTRKVKYSLVFTYHGRDTQVTKNTPSDLFPPIRVSTEDRHTSSLSTS